MIMMLMISSFLSLLLPSTAADSPHHHEAVYLPQWRGFRQNPSFDYYVLAQSWQPSFCHHKEHVYPGCRAPLAYWKTHFTLHGLWPEDNNGQHPDFCHSEPFDAAAVEQAIGFDTLVQYWPDVKYARGSKDYPQFWQHEWDRHGSCSGLSLVSFFQHAIDLVQHGNASTPSIVSEHVGASVSAEEIRSAFGGHEYAVLKCSGSGNVLSQVFTCWSKDTSTHTPTQRQKCSLKVQQEDTCHADTISIPAFPSL